MSLPSISDFYQNKSVLVTGFTGFLGKTLVEKLLRDCPHVETVYVLVRPSKDKSPSQRVEELVQGELFDILRSTNPSFDQQIRPVAADLALPNMGITDQAVLEEMRQHVSIILHCAATVNFNEKLNVSLATNVTSVKNLVAFARSLQRLDAFVHVSTAYAHCNLSHIEERLYAPPVDPNALIAAVETMGPELVAMVTKGLLDRRPNTYTFTKALAEAIVAAEAADLPVAVVRPSIVGCIAHSPLPGWSDNLNGPGGFYLAAANRVLRVMAGDSKGTLDVVPVDHCVNLIIAVAWQLGVARPSQPLVFNCTSGAVNPIILREHNEYLFRAIDRSPMQPGFFSKTWIPLCSLRQYQGVWNPLLHVLPAEAIDLYRHLVGKKPMMRRLYQKLNNSVQAYAFFTSHSWKWDVDNTLALQKLMNEHDRAVFSVDLSTLNWEQYIFRYYEGCKRFINEKPASGSSSPKSSMAGSDSAGSLSSVPSSESLISSPSSTSMMTASSAVNLNARMPVSQKTMPLAACFTSTLALLFVMMILIFIYDLLLEAIGAALGGSASNATSNSHHHDAAHSAIAEAVSTGGISESD